MEFGMGLRPYTPGVAELAAVLPRAIFLHQQRHGLQIHARLLATGGGRVARDSRPANVRRPASLVCEHSLSRARTRGSKPQDTQFPAQSRVAGRAVLVCA